jgi:hypothetical protein
MPLAQVAKSTECMPSMLMRRTCLTVLLFSSHPLPSRGPADRALEVESKRTAAVPRAANVSSDLCIVVVSIEGAGAGSLLEATPVKMYEALMKHKIAKNGSCAPDRALLILDLIVSNDGEMLA